MLYQEKALGKSGLWARLAARVASAVSGRRLADLDLLSLSPHLQRDLGIGEIWRK